MTFKNWYAINSERFNAIRKERYNTDPEYRERVIQANKESKARNKTERKVTRGVAARNVTTPDGLKQLFTVSGVAQLLQVSPQAIRKWEAEGKISPPEYRSEDKVRSRLYTQEEIEAIEIAMHVRGLARDKTSSIHPQDVTICYTNGSMEAGTVYLLGQIAIILRTTARGLTELQSRGLFPNLALIYKNKPVYTEKMVQTLLDVHSKYSEAPGMLDWANITSEVTASWAEETHSIASIQPKLPSVPV